MSNVENTIGRKSEGEGFISPKRAGCLVAFLYFPQAVIGLVHEIHELNNNLRILHADLRKSPAVDEAARIGQALEDFRRMTAPLLGWKDKGTTHRDRNS